MPVLMTAVFIAGCVLGYIDYQNTAARSKSILSENEDYISPEDELRLYRVVNIANPLDRAYVPSTVVVGGAEVDRLIANPLKKMIAAAAKQGVVLSVKYGYVSYDEQHRLYEDFVEFLLSTGKYTQVRAESTANRVICDSGNSERQLGLLVEFDTDNKGEFDKTGAYQWLIRNAKEYGFVQRYTKSGEQASAMDRDFTLWRFVGRQNAVLAEKLGLDFNDLVDYVKKEYYSE